MEIKAVVEAYLTGCTITFGIMA
jgi:hypothetical protein